jgi:hypothetical protein
MASTACYRHSFTIYHMYLVLGNGSQMLLLCRTVEVKLRWSVLLRNHCYLCCLQQLEDAFVQCGDLLDILALTQGLQDGPLDIYGNYYNSLSLSRSLS